MASTASQDPPAASDEVNFDDETEHFHGTQATVQTEDSQYEETSTADFVPLDTGHEEAVRETQRNAERPVSAGTASSAALEPDEAAMLVNLAAHSKIDDIHATEGPEKQESMLVRRPTSAGKLHTESIFSFAAAPRPQLDFSGTRKAPTAAMQPGGQHVSETTDRTNEEFREISDNADRVTDEVLLQIDAQDDQAVAISLPRDRRATSPLEDTSSVKKHKGRKNGKKRRYYSALPEQRHDHDMLAPTDFTNPTEVKPDSLQSIEASPSNDPDAFAAQHDILLADRPATPIQSGNEAEQPAQASNLHAEESDGVQDFTEQPIPAVVAPPPSRPTQLPQSPVNDLSAPESVPRARGSITRAESPLSIRTNATNDDPNGTRRRVSGRQGRPTISKPKLKKSRKPSVPNQSQIKFGDPKLDELNDYLQILQYKVYEQDQSSKARLAAQEESFHVELQRIVEGRQMLEADLNDALEQKERLIKEVEDQQLKLDDYVSKVKRFKTFVDGLGNDVSALKQEANASRDNWEQLAKESEDDRLQRDALFHQLSVCAERSAQFKADALIACKESQSELKNATENGIHLDRHLSEKSGLLAEARDRCSSLENQLKDQVALWKSSQEAHVELKLMLKFDNDAILDKLYIIHGMLEEHQNDEELSDIVKKTFGLVEALNSREVPTVDDMASVKGLVEGLDESVKTHLHSNRSAHEEQLESRVLTHLDEALQALKEQIVQREQSLQRDTTARETIAGLQEKLNTCNTRIIDADSQISAAQLREDQVKSENASLQTRITALQNKSSPTELAQVQLQDIKAELGVKLQALEAAKSELNKKNTELHNVNASNSSLQERLRMLQSRIDEMRSNVVDFGPEKEELEERAKQAEERVRREMSEHVEKFEVELRTQAENETKRLTSERNRLEKQVKPLEEELSSCKARIQELQKEISTGVAAKEQELDKLKSVALSRKQENESLQAALKDFQIARKDDAALSERCSTLVGQLEVQSKKLEEMREAKGRLLKQVEDFQGVAKASKRIEDQEKSELNAYRTDKEKALKELEKELAEAKENAEQTGAGLDKYKASCDGAVEEAKQEGERKVNALQERLCEAEAELQIAKDLDETFRAEVEQSWQAEQERFEKEKSELNQKIIEVEAQRDDTIRENEKIRQNLQKAMQEQSLPENLDQLNQRATALGQMPQVQQRPSSKASHESSQLRVPSIADGITPSASFKPTEPTKPKKNIDRNNSTEMDDHPVPAPDELRPDSRKTGSGYSSKGKEKALGPVVEESQLATTHAVKPAFFTSLSSSDDLLSMLDTGSQQLPQTVQETQQESLPSSAAFNTSIASSSQAPGYNAMSSPFDSNVTNYQTLTQPASSYATASRRDGYGRSTEQTQAGDFAIYEDKERAVESSKLKGSDSRERRQSSLSLSQTERDSYTYEKSFPHPNSASKIVHRDSLHSSTSRRQSDTQRSAMSRERVVNTLGLEVEDMRSRGSGQSSSPGFIHAGSGRKMSTYHASQGSGGKRHLSRTSSGLLTGPRLSNRNPAVALKRKAEAYGMGDYEDKRKKRPAVDRDGIVPDASRFNLRSRAQPSVSGLSSFPSMRSGPSSWQHGSSGSQTQSRMRTLAGGTSRAARGLKKPSKSDEYNARFSQELGGR